MSYTVDVQQDDEGNLIIQLPQDILERMGWTENDTILWKDNGDGTWSLTKQD